MQQSEGTFEQSRRKEDRKFWVTTLGIVALGATAVIISAKHDDAGSNEYRSIYLNRGGCLEDTPYDIDETANYFGTKTEGKNILTVVPQSANSYKPSTLNFTVDRYGILGIHATLQPADQATDAFMQRTC